MRVLFVSSGNSALGISPIIKNQGHSLLKYHCEVDYFVIKGKGIGGYLRNIPVLRKYLKTNKYDIVHAHYSLIGIISALAGARPLIVSLMGSDVYEYGWLKFTTKVFSKFFWYTTIVKSEKMKSWLNLPHAIVIPNGVDIQTFKPLLPKEINKNIKFSGKPLVLFIGNPLKKEKNLVLANEALAKLSNTQFEFLPLHGIDNSLVPSYMNLASVLVMTSIWEGSPNVIKEAMACCCPIVTTDVGDVKWVIGETAGCYVTTYNPEDIADKIKAALAFNNRTNGRERIIKIGLDSESVAEKIISVYNKVSVTSKGKNS